MKNFFSAVQGKFDSGFEGRYLGNILEQISEFRPEIMYPFFEYAGLKYKRSSKKNSVSLETEHRYLKMKQSARDSKSRQADLLVRYADSEKEAQILVEIKINDHFQKEQLEDYCEWLSHANQKDENVLRAVLVLTAFPLRGEVSKKLQNYVAEGLNIKHVYLSKYADDVRCLDAGSDLVTMFLDYLIGEGYAMYQTLSIINKTADDVNKYRANEYENDYAALLSFMVLNFLPHASGLGRVSTSMKVSNGPLVFSKIVQNWQMISERFAGYLRMSRTATVRYFPEQGAKSWVENIDMLSPDSIFFIRRDVRRSKLWGRYWLTAQCLLKNAVNGPSSKEDVKIEWGQVIQIRRGGSSHESKAGDIIECLLYALVISENKQIGGSVVPLSDGIRDKVLYDSELFIEKLSSILKGVMDQKGVRKVIPDGGSFL